jgi:hypothetical protein
VKGCHTLSIRGCTHVVCVRFSPTVYASIQIIGTLSDMIGGLFAMSSRTIYCCSSKSCTWLLLMTFVDATYITDVYF